jgi:putative colanic acid biosynthesis acetyltransferase WcaF
MSILSSVPAPRPARPATARRLQDFTGEGYDKGRPVGWQIAWWVVAHLVFQAWWCPARLRPVILRAFGARIGHGANIRNGVRVHWPWKLVVGDHCWIGEGVRLLNLEPITLGHQVCLSQEAVLCTGSHRRRDPAFAYDNAPIVVGDGAWVALRALVLRGAVVPADGLVPAGAVVGRPVPVNESPTAVTPAAVAGR